MTLGGRRFLLSCAVVAAAACLALGVSLPFMRLTKLVLYGYGAYGHSLLSAVNALVRSDQAVFAGILLVFAIFLPLLKLLYLLLLAALPLAEIARSAGQLRALEWLGRWSLQDILALALTAVLIASQHALAQRAGSGAYLFAAAVLAMVLASAWLRRDVSAVRMRAGARAAAYASATRGPVFAALLLLALVSFALGVTLPAVRLATAHAGSDAHSIASLLWALHARGERVLWLVLLTLAGVLPGLRLLFLLTLALPRSLPHAVRARAVMATELLGRYAMADTMVLALMLFYLVAAGEADAPLQPGAYCLAASALLTLLAYAWANMRSPSPAAQGSSLAARLAGLASADTSGKA
jgi:paraquat-inducible protein A